MAKYLGFVEPGPDEPWEFTIPITPPVHRVVTGAMKLSDYLELHREAAQAGDLRASNSTHHDPTPGTAPAPS